MRHPVSTAAIVINEDEAKIPPGNRWDVARISHREKCAQSAAVSGLPDEFHFCNKPAAWEPVLLAFPVFNINPGRQGLFQRAGRFLLNMAAGEGPARDKSVAFFLQIRLVPPDGFTLAATGFHPALLRRGLPSLNPRATTSR